MGHEDKKKESFLIVGFEQVGTRLHVASLLPLEHVDISDSPTRRRGNDALLSSNVEATFSGAI